jgi:hypothetical protein
MGYTIGVQLTAVGGDNHTTALLGPTRKTVFTTGPHSICSCRKRLITLPQLARKAIVGTQTRTAYGYTVIGDDYHTIEPSHVRQWSPLTHAAHEQRKRRVTTRTRHAETLTCTIAPTGARTAPPKCSSRWASWSSPGRTAGRCRYPPDT